MQLKKPFLTLILAVSLISCDTVVGPEILNADVFEVFDSEVSDIYFSENGETGWASNKYGDIAHYANGAWRLQEKLPIPEGYWGGSVKIYGLDFTAPDDGWAVGGFTSEATYGVIYHYDGKEWAVAEILGGDMGVLYSVAALAPDDVWFGGFAGKLIYFNGIEFKEYPYGEYLSDIYDIEFYSPDFGLALDRYGEVLFFDGSSWIYWTLPINMGCTGNQALSIVKPDDIWSVGFIGPNGEIPAIPLAGHFDGERWTEVTITEGNTTFTDVHFSEWNNGWVVASEGGWHFDGREWTFYDTPDYSPRCVTVTDTGGVWMGCSNGYVLKVRK